MIQFIKAQLKNLMYLRAGGNSVSNEYDLILSTSQWGLSHVLPLLNFLQSWTVGGPLVIYHLFVCSSRHLWPTFHKIYTFCGPSWIRVVKTKCVLSYLNKPTFILIRDNRNWEDTLSHTTPHQWGSIFDSVGSFLVWSLIYRMTSKLSGSPHPICLRLRCGFLH